jgi:hypothetical protein
MDQTLLEIPAVILVLSFIGIVLIRAFTSGRGDDIDVFMRRHGPSDRPTRR